MNHFHLLEADQTWVRVLGKELYGKSVAEIRKALHGKHPERIIEAVCRETGAYRK